ncbi:hypothetical protein BURPSS13_C0125 [Burkholderia pseudomallei S13]|nr:hypothetical protein BURPSS13_C0125 [Burkholderia pseudomallei S13]
MSFGTTCVTVPSTQPASGSDLTDSIRSSRTAGAAGARLPSRAEKACRTACCKSGISTGAALAAPVKPAAINGAANQRVIESDAPRQTIGPMKSPPSSVNVIVSTDGTGYGSTRPRRQTRPQRSHCEPWQLDSHSLAA